MKLLNALVHTDSMLIAAIALAFSAFLVVNLEASSFELEQPITTALASTR